MSPAFVLLHFLQGIYFMDLMGIFESALTDYCVLWKQNNSTFSRILGGINCLVFLSYVPLTLPLGLAFLSLLPFSTEIEDKVLREIWNWTVDFPFLASLYGPGITAGYCCPHYYQVLIGSLSYLAS